MYSDENEKVLDQREKELKNYRLAEVTELFEDGCAKIKFYGEDNASDKEYPYLTTYKPCVGDNVVLLKTSNSYIILGKVVYKETPVQDNESEDEIKSIISTYLTENDYVHLWSDGTIANYSTNYNEFKKLKATDTFNHDGNYLGFYGVGTVSRQSVGKLSSSAGTSSIITTVNNLLTALNKVGIISSS